MFSPRDQFPGSVVYGRGNLCCHCQSGELAFLNQSNGKMTRVPPPLSQCTVFLQRWVQTPLPPPPPLQNLCPAAVSSAPRWYPFGDNR